jgi:hypothetical protein
MKTIKNNTKKVEPKVEPDPLPRAPICILKDTLTYKIEELHDVIADIQQEYVISESGYEASITDIDTICSVLETLKSTLNHNPLLKKDLKDITYDSVDVTRQKFLPYRDYRKPTKIRSIKAGEDVNTILQKIVELAPAKNVESFTSTINKCEEEFIIETVNEESVVEIQAEVQTVLEVKPDTSSTVSLNKCEETVTNNTPITTKGKTKMLDLKAQGFVSGSDNSTVNTNKEIMQPVSKSINLNAKIVKAELVVNIVLSANGVLSQSTLATAQAKKGVIINTRSVGTLRYNTSDSSVYSDFVPLAENANDKYGNYNCAIWRLTDEEGNVSLLNHEESINYWTAIFNEEGLSADELNYFVKVNFPAVHTYSSVNEMLANGQVRSYIITFNDLANMFTFRKDEYRQNLCLIPVNSTVEFSSSVAELDKETLGGDSISMSAVKVQTTLRRTQFKDFLKSSTKSLVRRDARKEASAETKEVSAATFDFSPSTPVVVIPEVTAEVVSNVEPEFSDAEIAAFQAEELAREIAMEAIADALANQEPTRPMPTQVQAAQVLVEGARTDSTNMSADEFRAKRAAEKTAVISETTTVVEEAKPTVVRGTRQEEADKKKARQAAERAANTVKPAFTFTAVNVNSDDVDIMDQIDSIMDDSDSDYSAESEINW